MEATVRWWEPLDVVTVVDVLDTGACLDGVVDWVARHHGRIAGNPVLHTNTRIAKAARLSGSGSGYGYGSGDGYGYGSGYGYGDGSGSGDGYGYGYGDGDGSGYG